MARSTRGIEHARRRHRSAATIDRIGNRFLGLAQDIADALVWLRRGFGFRQLGEFGRSLGRGVGVEQRGWLQFGEDLWANCRRETAIRVDSRAGGRG